MRRILTAAEMSAADAYTINEIGVPSLVLMERAALSVVEEILDKGIDASKTLVVCGPGNNGGDGAAIARMLAEKGFSPEILIIGDKSKQSEQLKTQLKILKFYDIKEVTEFAAGKYTLIVDAIFGIGLSREITGRTKELIDSINADAAYKVAVDIASGIEGSTGRMLGCAVQADLTVTFARGKIGHYIYPGVKYTGELAVKEIGIPADNNGKIFCIDENDILSLPKRDEYGNKGTFGKLLVIAGSKNICGAAYFSAAAALKCGAGMVKIYTHSANRAAISTLIPEALIDTYEEYPSEAELENALDWADGVVIGPGIGTGENAVKLLEGFVNVNTLPAVLDADALNIISKDDRLWNKIKFNAVITPHIGEMSRLTKKSVDEIKSEPLEVAGDFAKQHNAVCVLKDAVSVTAYPDGKCYINTSGNSALSTAGSGDVLTGILGAFIVKYKNADFPLAAMGVYIHGLLGERAAEEIGKDAVTASDIISALNGFKL